MALKYLKTNGNIWYVRPTVPAGQPRPAYNLGTVKDYPREKDIEEKYHLWMIEHSKQKQEPTKANLTVADLWRKFEKSAEVNLKPSTLKGYRQFWNRHFEDSLSNKKVREFQRADARELLETLERKGHAPNFVINARSALSSLFQYAIDKDFLTTGNPIHGLKLDSDKKRKKRDDAGEIGPHYTLDEIEAGLAILTGQQKAIVAVFAFAALRPGEVAALKWEDYDGKTLSIDRAVWEGEVGTPKDSKQSGQCPGSGPASSGSRCVQGNHCCRWLDVSGCNWSTDSPLCSRGTDSPARLQESRG